MRCWIVLGLVLSALSALSCETGTSDLNGSSETSGAGGARATGGSASENLGGATAGGASGTGGSSLQESGGNAAGGQLGGLASGGALNGASAGGQTGSSGGASPNDGEWLEAFPHFVSHTISASFQSGYAVAAADIDGDGLQDVVALSSGAPGVVWFKNPSWEKFNITSATTRLIYMAPHDVDGDGDTDLAIASEFSMTDTNVGGTVYWAERPEDPTQDQEWPLHLIGSVPTSHRLRWGDIDGDGTKELLDLPIFGKGATSPEYIGPVELTAFSSSADPSDTWSKKVLSDSLLEVAHGLAVVDWDGDKAEDILAAAGDGLDLFRPSLQTAPQHIGDGKEGTRPTRGSSEVGLGTLGGSRFIAAIEPWHGTDAVIYTQGAAETDAWVRETIGTDFQHGHGLVVADFNNDGYDEVIGGGGEGDMTQLIYRYVPSQNSWEKIELDIGGVAVSGIDVKDMNGDGAPDIISIGGSPTNNVVWYENVPSD